MLFLHYIVNRLDGFFIHGVKSVHIRSFYGPYFLAFRPNPEVLHVPPYSVWMRENTYHKNSDNFQKYGHFSRIDNE